MTIVLIRNGGGTAESPATDNHHVSVEHHPVDDPSYVGQNEARDLQLRFSKAALRHGISAERASFVVEHCPRPLYETGPSAAPRVVFLGFDAHGVPLEVVAIELGEDEFVVIHAMRVRKRYAAQFREVMRWRDS